MFSEDDDLLSMTPKQRYDRAAARLLTQAAERFELCIKYARRLRDLGYDVDAAYVNSFFPWVSSWADGLIKIGQLQHRLGFRRMSRRDYLEWSRTMNIPRAVMLDTIRTSAHNIPKATPFIGGYVSGSGSVPWTETEWAMFPGSRHVRIYQDPSHTLDPHSWDAIDLESGAFNAAQAAQEHKRHVDAGIQWTTIYATRTNLALATKAIKALGEEYWNGHVCYWLADWNLDQEQASALIGTFVEGATCVAVQWASPSSNPHSVVPGGSYLLAQANIDVSVVDAGWIPSVKFTNPNPPAPAPTVEHGEVVTQDSHGNYVGHEVSSTDGTHWQ